MVSPIPNPDGDDRHRPAVDVLGGKSFRWRYLWLWHLVGGGLVTVVIVLSLGPPATLPSPTLLSDKVGHVLAYATLVGWYGQFLSRPRFGLAVVLLGAMGLALEGLQALTATRVPEWADVGANLIGLLVGGWVSRGWSSGWLARVDEYLARG